MTAQQTKDDRGYLSAILRPNITTTESYVESFANGLGNIQFIHDNLSEYFVPKDAFVAKLKSYYADEKYSVSCEIGKNSTEVIISMRFVVTKPRAGGGIEIVCVLLLAEKSFTVFFRGKEEVAPMMRYLRSKRHVKQAGIIRCNFDGTKTSFSRFKTEAKYRIQDAFYPQIKEGASAFLKRFLAADANILMLYGQWGGGKSSLMRGTSLLNHKDHSYYLIDDPSIYQLPAAFTSIVTRIQNNTRENITTVLFLEESDDYLRSKKDNPFLSKLLSISSGVTQLKVKIIIATNDETQSRLDPALLRGGRLFGSVGFRTLTPSEACAAREAIKLPPMVFDHDVSLSEALGGEPADYGIATTVSKRTPMGFTA